MRYKRITGNELKEGNLESIYDQIRMRDGSTYPRTYLRFGGLKMEFSRASLRHDGVLADVRFTEM